MANDKSFKQTIGNFFKSISDGVDNLTLEAKLESAYKNTEGNIALDIYQENNLTSHTYYGALNECENTAVIYCDKDTKINYSSILVTKDDKKFYIIDTKEIDISIPLKDGEDKVNVYTHFGLALTLDPNVIEIKAVRVKNSYYLLKEKTANEEKVG
jgi:hypothetical protein